MLTTIFTLVFTLSGLLPIGQIEPRSHDGGGETSGTAERRANDADEADSRERRRDRWERYRNATPERRREMRNEQMLEMAVETYDLDDTQKELVRAQMEAMAIERRLAMGPQADEYDRLREQMFEHWRSRRADEGDRPPGPQSWREMRDDPEFRRLRERMREIERQYPFDWRESIERVESLLPPDQAKKGRERLEQRWARMREGWGRRGDRRNPRDRSGAPSEDSRTEALNQEIQAARVLLEQAEKDGLPLQVRAERRARLEALEQSSRNPSAEPVSQAELHPWEKYVREFIDRHSLAPEQQSAAMSILKDLRQRASQIEQSIAGRVQDAEKIQDPDLRSKRLQDLHKPIESTFEELKRRLEGLLSASQRKQSRDTSES